MDSYEGYTWCWLDTSYNVPFGSEPSWMQYYVDRWVTYEYMYNDVTIAFCDLDGAISL